MKHEVERSILEMHAEPGAVLARLCFRSELTVFAGHFPNVAIVPGVFLVEATRLLAERAVGKTLRIAEVANARFTAQIAPDEDVTANASVSASAEGDGGPVTCDAVFRTGDRQAAKIRLLLAAE